MGVAKQVKRSRIIEKRNRLLWAAPDASVIRKAQNSILSLRAFVEASDDAIIGKTMDGTIVSWNKGAERMYGYTAEEILGKSILVLIPPGHPNEFPEIMMRLKRGEHIERYETKRIHKNGNAIDASLTISPVKGTGGTVVGACAIARDITEQRRDQESLRLSEERFRVALKNAPVMVSSQDVRLRYIWINASSLGLAQEVYLGHTDAEIFGDDGARLTVIKEEALRTGAESHTEVTISLEGRRHYFDLVVEPVRDAEGTALGLLCSAIDITSLRETIAQLQQALDEIQTLRGLLPICASCNKIEDERGTWQPLEKYLQSHSEARFSHSLCPDCLRKLYPEYHPE